MDIGETKHVWKAIEQVEMLQSHILFDYKLFNFYP